METTHRSAPRLWGTAANALNVTWQLYEWSQGRMGRAFFANFAESKARDGAPLLSTGGRMTPAPVAREAAEEIRAALAEHDNPEEVKASIRALAEHYREHHGMSNRDMQGEELRQSAAAPFAEAPMYLVTREMTTVAVHASRSMQDQPLLPTDLPSESGVILLDGDYPHMIDVHGNRVGTAAFSWRTVLVVPGDKPGILVAFWSDMLDPGDDISRRLYEEDPEMAARLPRLSLVHVAGWEFGNSVAAPFGQEIGWLDEEDAKAWGETQGVLRVFTALCSLMRQRIAVTSEGRLPRQTRREHARRARPLPDLKVISLRRAWAPGTERSPEPKHVDWSARWMVSGHWREQWYPSINGHRQIWIAPFIKGPKDKPLVMPDEVYKLRR